MNDQESNDMPSELFSGSAADIRNMVLSHSAEAVKTLAELMQPGNRSSTRCRAATTILDWSVEKPGRGHDEVWERLARLERALGLGDEGDVRSEPRVLQ